MKKVLNNRFFQLGLVLIVGLFLGWWIFKPAATPKHEHVLEQGEETIYTCSMHPQIRQNEPGDCPICGMELIPLVQTSAMGEGNPMAQTMSPEAMALANVQTQPVRTVTPEREIYLTGKVEVNEQKLSVITADYSGRIEKLFVDFTGQNVNQGQKLASIYSPELVTAQKELIEAAKYKSTNPALYQAARQKLRLWNITEGQIKAIEERGIVLTELDVYSDQSGIVIRREIATGDYVNKGAVLFEIADLSSVWILLDAYESDLPFLRNGQKINITVASIPGRDFSSSITFIDPIINPQTRTAAVRAELNNPQQMLKPQMFVTAKITASLSVKDKAMVIPNTSILWTGKRSVAYVRVPDAEFPTFEMREITLGAALGEYYIVEGGLSEGEEVVTNGVFAIDAAAQLSGNYSMMNRSSDNKLAIPEKLSDQLTEVVTQYFELKNNLVNSDFQQSRSVAKGFESALKNIDMDLMDSEAHKTWMPYYLDMKEQTELFLHATDLAKQREVFAALSSLLIETTELFSIKFDTIFVAYCPMALNDQGAYWLSEFEEIRNPYFGDEMLTCGEVKKKIEKPELIDSKPDQHQGHQH